MRLGAAGVGYSAGEGAGHVTCRPNVSTPGPPTACPHLSARSLFPEHVHRKGQTLPLLQPHPAASLATISRPVVEGGEGVPTSGRTFYI